MRHRCRILIVAMLAGLLPAACNKSIGHETKQEEPKTSAAQQAPAVSKRRVPKPRIVYAVWYDVPVNSLAHRRARQGELTAAHNSLRLGTLVRVTRISNGKSVVVRITDRGITGRRAKIDVCREAAKELDMVAD